MQGTASFNGAPRGMSFAQSDMYQYFVTYARKKRLLLRWSNLFPLRPNAAPPERNFGGGEPAVRISDESC